MTAAQEAKTRDTCKNIVQDLTSPEGTEHYSICFKDLLQIKENFLAILLLFNKIMLQIYSAATFQATNIFCLLNNFV